MQNKTAIVTGAVGGIGSVVATALAKRGVKVAAVDLDAGRLEQYAAESIADTPAVTAFPADVTDSAAVHTLVGEVERRLGPVDFLVNAAGVLHLGPVVGFGDDEWARTMQVNVTGVFHMCRAVAERMAPGARGRS